MQNGIPELGRFEYPATDDDAVFLVTAAIGQQVGADPDSSETPSPEQTAATTIDLATLTCGISIATIPPEVLGSDIDTTCTTTEVGYDYGAFECTSTFSAKGTAIATLRLSLVKARFTDQRTDRLTGALLLAGSRVFRPYETCGSAISVESYVLDDGTPNPWFGATAGDVAFTAVEPQPSHPLTVALCDFQGPVAWAPVVTSPDGTNSFAGIYDTAIAACDAAGCIVD